ncbi:MAG: glycosyltransferase family 2 protein [Chitinophagaceae bacterium]|nr:glycosyltransferase family 2 protein [Chitinophagaceae bacterium]
MPLISICIPAYKKPAYVTRLLDSVLNQTYRQVEVIISDDSPDDSVKIAIEPYKSKLSIHYKQNNPALKSPMNWNNAIAGASGDFFILLHQDDWLHDRDALSKYLKAFELKPEAGFVFCKNIGVMENGEQMVLQHIPSLLTRLKEKPLHLVLAQVIGPPSNTMLRISLRDQIQYDNELIWLVDVDYYVRILQKGYEYVYLDEHLVSIGLHEDQTTVFVRNNETIILKENILFAYKIGKAAFNDIKIYDYYWRLLRNHKVRSLDAIVASGVNEQKIIPVIRHMLRLQQILPMSILKVGLFSKSFMLFNYLNR